MTIPPETVRLIMLDLATAVLVGNIASWLIISALQALARRRK
jgi:hypothetical protein